MDPKGIHKFIHFAVTQLGNENVIAFGIAPGGDVIALDGIVALRQVFFLWRPAKQGDDVIVMFVNESCNRSILDHIDPASNEGVPRSRGTDYRRSKVEFRG
jgi:hypothetical protein